MPAELISTVDAMIAIPTARAPGEPATILIVDKVVVISVVWATIRPATRLLEDLIIVVLELFSVKKVRFGSRNEMGR